jgi:TPR repeat protein
MKKLLLVLFGFSGFLYAQEAGDYQKAAEAGDAAAQYELGHCYDEGLGVKKDREKTVYWYTKAAEQGFAQAQYNLGVFYENGGRLLDDWYNHDQSIAISDKDLEEALYWYTKAAEQGYAVAQRKLGSCYEWGWGVKKDSEKAVYWYTKAAEQGNAAAQTALEKIKGAR